MQQEFISIQYQIYNHGDELDNLQLNLLKQAEIAALNAYAPYSDFKVGAAILMDNNQIITGCNQENASYPCGICAERAALFAYGNQSQKNFISKMAITTINNKEVYEKPVAPCGLCRQVMSEFENQNHSEIELILGHSKSFIYVFSSVLSLLPLHFHRGDLLSKYL